MTLGPRRSALQLDKPMGRFPDVVTTMFVTRCRRRDSNPHTTRHRNLNPACLPIPPLRHRGRSGPRATNRPSVFPNQQSILSSLQSLSTWPLARILYWASTILHEPSAPTSTTKVERMTPTISLP